MSEKLLRLRYPATCSSCGGALARGTEAGWNRETKTATCAICLGAPEVTSAAAAEAIERGEAGGSAGARVAPKARPARACDSLALRQAGWCRPCPERRPALDCSLGLRR